MKRFELIFKRLYYTIEGFDLIICPLIAGAGLYNTLCVQEGIPAADNILLWAILTSLYLDVKIKHYRNLDLSRIQVEEDDDDDPDAI